jgi:hypothetical protein
MGQFYDLLKRFYKVVVVGLQAKEDGLIMPKS